MIDPQVFLKSITLLCSHFDRKLLPEVTQLWKEYLDQRLTTAQFEKAVKLAILEQRFFPTAKELVESVAPNTGVLSLQDWQTCLRAAARDDREAIQNLSPAGKFALNAIGGLHQLGQSKEEEHQWVQKRFVEAYKSWIPSLETALPPSASQQPADFTADLETAARFQQLYQQASMTNRNGHSKPSAASPVDPEEQRRLARQWLEEDQGS